MAVSKIAVSLDQRSVRELDRCVREGKYANRSRALQAALDAWTERQRRLRLASESAHLDEAEEQALAEEFLHEPWPQY